MIRTERKLSRRRFVEYGLSPLIVAAGTITSLVNTWRMLENENRVNQKLGSAQDRMKAIEAECAIPGETRGDCITKKQAQFDEQRHHMYEEMGTASNIDAAVIGAGVAVVGIGLKSIAQLIDE